MSRRTGSRARRDTAPPIATIKSHLTEYILSDVVGVQGFAGSSLQLGACRRNRVFWALSQHCPNRSSLSSVRSSVRWSLGNVATRSSPTPTQIQHRPSRSLIVTIGSDERSEARSNQPTDRVASSRRRDRCVRADRVATTASLRAALFSLSTVLEESRSEVHARARGRARCDHRARRVV